MTKKQRNKSNHIFTIGFSLVFAVLLNITNVFGQKNNDDDSEPTPWVFTINTGVAFSSNYQANYYNGAEGNENEMSFILGNKYFTDEIRRAVNDTFSLYAMPTDMHYKPAVAVGMTIKKKFSKSFGAIMQFNYSRFRTSDFFTLKIGATPSSQAFPDLRNYTIWGKEDRFNIDLGVYGELPFNDNISGLLEGGFNLNNVRVKENKINIEYLEYSLVNIYGNQQYIPNTPLQEYPIKQGGIGIGCFLSPGLNFKFNNNMGVDLIGTIYWSKINLKHYDSFRLNYNVMLRFTFNTTVQVTT